MIRQKIFRDLKIHRLKSFFVSSWSGLFFLILLLILFTTWNFRIETILCLTIKLLTFILIESELEYTDCLSHWRGNAQITALLLANLVKVKIYLPDRLKINISNLFCQAPGPGPGLDHWSLTWSTWSPTWPNLA